MAGKQSGGAKLLQLEIANTKKVKLFSTTLSPTMNIIGGKNAQGKTTVVDVIKWALLGNKFKPSNPKRNDSILPPDNKITLDNGFIIEIKGENSTVVVTDPSGKKAGTSLLKDFISEFALDIPTFMAATDANKVKMILKHFRVVEELVILKAKEEKIYNERTVIGVDKDRKRKFANSLELDESVGFEPKKIQDLIDQQQLILGRNGQNQQKRNDLESNKVKLTNLKDSIAHTQSEILRLQNIVAEKEIDVTVLEGDIQTAETSVSQLQDESTEELNGQIQNFELFNDSVKKNLEYQKADDEAEGLKVEYDKKTAELNTVRDDQKKILDTVEIPLDGVEIKDSKLLYKGQEWDCMSGAEQYMVAIATICAISPETRFILLDKLEQLDLDSLSELDEWIKERDLQVIATRVSKGDECQIIIEDGEISSTTLPTITKQEEPELEDF